MTTIKSVLYRPPLIGLLAFLLVFVVQGLGHTLMVAMEAFFGHDHVLQAATLLGLFGAVLLFVGMRHDGEVAGTWLGFWAGTFLWTGWVEFSFVWAGDYLAVPDLMDPATGEIATKNEYLVMMSSLGLLMSTLVYFTLNKETKCNMFRWMQRRLKLSTGKPTPRYPRNFAAITCLETIYVLWFCYLALLFMYEETILGEHHPVTYGLFFANTVWAIYLIQRLVRFWKVTTAIRYAIPTAIIAYNSWEILERWGVISDFWVEPQAYALPLLLITGAVLVAAILAYKTPAHVKKLMNQERPVG
ncbi:MAG: hypothetical protein QNJ73_13040 [Gammaproteobacteria bacterium]|nr:hypothetical protein [Gammaproteobacteria bacterium]